MQFRVGISLAENTSTHLPSVLRTSLAGDLFGDPPRTLRNSLRSYKERNISCPTKTAKKAWFVLHNDVVHLFATAKKPELIETTNFWDPNRKNSDWKVGANYGTFTFCQRTFKKVTGIALKKDTPVQLTISLK